MSKNLGWFKMSFSAQVWLHHNNCASHYVLIPLLRCLFIKSFCKLLDVSDIAHANDTQAAKVWISFDREISADLLSHSAQTSDYALAFVVL